MFLRFEISFCLMQQLRRFADVDDILCDSPPVLEIVNGGDVQTIPILGGRPLPFLFSRDTLPLRSLLLLSRGEQTRAKALHGAVSMLPYSLPRLHEYMYRVMCHSVCDLSVK